MSRVRCFDPVEDSNAEVLILGSMPGRASLAASEYYAHPQNTFWRIICELLALDVASPYATRVQALKSARIALWDVLLSCMREGSLDARIQPGMQTANDFAAFFLTHRKITRVFFNGAKAEACFRKHALPLIDAAAVSCQRLPSTSPAHASMSYAQKLSAWRTILASPPAKGRRGIG